jgi:hypothetical protein
MTQVPYRQPRGSPASSYYYIRATSVGRPGEMVEQLHACDGDGFVVPRTSREWFEASAAGELYHGERGRAGGSTRDLPSTSAVVKENQILNHLSLSVGGTVTRRTIRGDDLGIWPAAAALISRLLERHEPLVAITSVTSDAAMGARSLLDKVGTIPVKASTAEKLHPALGAYFKKCKERLHSGNLVGEDIWLWIYTKPSIKYFAGLLYDAAGPDGAEWHAFGEDIRIKVEGLLARPEVRSQLSRIADGDVEFPIDILPNTVGEIARYF